MYVNEKSRYFRLKVLFLLALIWIVGPLLFGRCVKMVRADEPIAPAFPTVIRISFMAPEAIGEPRAIWIVTDEYGLVVVNLFEDGTFGVHNHSMFNDPDPAIQYFNDWVSYMVNRKGDDPCEQDIEPRYSGYMQESVGLAKVATYMMLVSMADTWRLLAGTPEPDGDTCMILLPSVTWDA